MKFKRLRVTTYAHKFTHKFLFSKVFVATPTYFIGGDGCAMLHLSQANHTSPSSILVFSPTILQKTPIFAKISPTSSRKAPTFLEKSPTFFRTTPTFFLYIPALAASHSPLSTTGRPHRRTIYRQPRALAQPNSEGSQALFSTSFAKPTFQTLSIKHKITHTFHRKGKQKGGFHPSHPFFLQ